MFDSILEFRCNIKTHFTICNTIIVFIFVDNALICSANLYNYVGIYVLAASSKPKKEEKMKLTTLILLLAFSVCSAQKNEKNIITIPNAPGIVYEIGNGELFEGAIKIKNTKGSTEGIDAETKYMEYKYGVINVDFIPFGSEFYKVKRKTYNIIHIQFIKKEGTNQVINKDEFTTLYFDVTECLEK